MKNITITDTLQFARKYPEAFLALPETYQGDNCLQFHINDSGAIKCSPLPDQVSELGQWECIYLPDQKKWWKIGYAEVPHL